eukprot:5391613-Alexandrium_andersonii.AAC.1
MGWKINSTQLELEDIQREATAVGVPRPLPGIVLEKLDKVSLDFDKALLALPKLLRKTPEDPSEQLMGAMQQAYDLRTDRDYKCVR